MKLLRFVTIPVVLFLVTGCVVSGEIRPVLQPSARVDVSELWREPVDLADRDLFHGPGGAGLMPVPGIPFTFLKSDEAGFSPGYDVRDQEGVEWSVKLGLEAQSEVAVSRVLWALGYHQPPTYYVSGWTLEGKREEPQPGGRFRPRLADRTIVGEWDWYENGFLDTTPFKGLIVVNVMLNNWDWKTSNNRIYESAGQREYVVQDVGASLGKTDYPRMLGWLPMRGLAQGSRNDLEDFEEQGFIEGVDSDRVKFVYRGIHRALLDRLTRADVIWAAERMATLSDSQWNDIFKAAGYSEGQRRRYIAKIQTKIAEGLSLKTEGRR